MLYGDKTSFPKINLGTDVHPEDAIGPRLALAAAATNMLLVLEWATLDGYVNSNDEDEITPSGLAHTICRMLVEIDTLRDMESDIIIGRRPK